MNSSMHTRFFHASLIVVLAIVAQGCKSANQPQTRFGSPELAVHALVNAARAGDTAQLKAIFGPDAMEVLGSGDPVADEQARKQFLARYDEKHELIGGSDSAQSMQLLIGD